MYEVFVSDFVLELTDRSDTFIQKGNYDWSIVSPVDIARETYLQLETLPCVSINRDDDLRGYLLFFESEGEK